MADDLLAAIEDAIKEIHGAGPSDNDIKSCLLRFDGRPPICLSNVKSTADCNQIAAIISTSGKYGLVTAQGNDSPCNLRTHTAVSTPSRTKRGARR